MNTKICHKCKQVKYINKFYKCKTSKDGLQNICMICCGLWNKRYTLEHNETKKICNKN